MRRNYIFINLEHPRYFQFLLLPANIAAIFGNLRKFSGNVRQRLCDLRASLGEASEIFGKSSKTPSSVYLYNKKNTTR